MRYETKDGGGGGFWNRDMLRGHVYEFFYRLSKKCDWVDLFQI